MKISYTYTKIDYLFTNENLKEVDKVYSISRGYCSKEIGYIHHEFDFHMFTEYIDDPHIITNLHHSDYLPYQISTNNGYGPVESYYKLMPISLNKNDYEVHLYKGKIRIVDKSTLSTVVFFNENDIDTVYKHFQLITWLTYKDMLDIIEYMNAPMKGIFQKNTFDLAEILKDKR